MHFFVVFHKHIFDECYKDLTQEELDTYFTFVAVNPDIEKSYDKNKYKVIQEWELPVYDPTLQSRGYKENSVLYHVWANKLYEPYSHVGFFQYDMVFTRDFIQKALSIPKGTYGAFEVYPFNFIFDTWNREYTTAKYVTDDYARYFGKEFSFTADYPLYNTFILPTSFYADKMMPWISQTYVKLWPWCNQAPNATHFGHVAGVYERISAMVIGEEKMPYVLIDIKHDHEYKKLSY